MAFPSGNKLMSTVVISCLLALDIETEHVNFPMWKIVNTRLMTSGMTFLGRVGQFTLGILGLHCQHVHNEAEGI